MTHRRRWAVRGKWIAAALAGLLAIPAGVCALAAAGFWLAEFPPRPGWDGP